MDFATNPEPITRTPPPNSNRAGPGAREDESAGPDAPAAPIKPELNPDEEDFRDALATLMWRKGLSSRSLYDHITAMIRLIYTSTTQGKEDVWSNKLDLLSRLVKRYNVPPVGMHFIKPGYVDPLELATFHKLRDYFTPFDEEESKRVDHNGPVPPGIGYVPPDQPLESFPPPTALDDEDEGLEEGEPRPVYKPIDMYEWLFYVQEAVIEMSQTEMYLAMTAILRFQKAHFNDLQRMRFWGKIQGSQRAYYVLECQFKEMSEKWYDMPVAVDAHPELAGHKVTVYNPFGTFGIREDFDETFFTLNLAKYPVPSAPAVDPDQHFKEVLPEESGSGANMFCYYVCNDLTDWQRLPDVTPEQIRKARFLRRGFTGNLTAKLVTCPVFPGTEANYLRAQIARISHGTTIGPLGQYTPPDEDEDPGDGEGSANFKLVENPEFEHPNLRDVLSKNLTGYAHNLPFLLRQGRCSWYNPSPRGLPLGEDEEEEPEEEEPAEGEEGGEEEKIKWKKLVAKPEMGPAVFSPVTDDREVAKEVQAWVVKPTNTFLPQNGVVKLCSILWPGAVCLVQKDKSENVYVGDGVTKSTDFTPYLPPAPQQVFNQSVKILQHSPDPAPQLEEEQRLKKVAAEKAKLEAAEAEKENADATEDGEEGEEGEEDENGETEEEQ